MPGEAATLRWPHAEDRLPGRPGGRDTICAMSRRYWDAQLETLLPERRRLLREHRLHWQVQRSWDGSPFYRAWLEAGGLDPTTFDGLADWARLPILRAADLPSPHEWAVAPQSW